MSQELHFYALDNTDELINAHSRAMAQAVSLRPITAGDGFVPRLVRVRFVVDSTTFGRHSHSTSLFPCQYHFTNAPYLNTTLSRGTTGEVNTGVKVKQSRYRLGVAQRVPGS